MNKRKSILILGASLFQLPAIRKAKEMGINVIAVDMDKHAIGFKEAHVCLEISTIDISRVVAAAEAYKVDAVMTLASDMPMRTVAAVARKLDLVGITEDTALRATNKALMRKCLRDHNIPVPQFFCASDYSTYKSAIEQINGRFIVKPADNSGSRGVFLVEHKENISYAYDYSKKYSRSGEIIVEEFMEGPEVSVETLSVDGTVHIIAVTDKLTTGAPRFVEIGHSQPACLSKDVRNKIEAVTAAAVKAIGIENGPSHTEIIVTNEGPKVVEIGARLGGDNITTHLVPLSTGVDMVECCIKIALGQKPEIESKIYKGAAIRFFAPTKGTITQIEGVNKAEDLPGIKKITLVKNIGDRIGDISSSLDRIGFVIAQADSAKEAIDACNNALGRIEISIE